MTMKNEIEELRALLDAMGGEDELREDLKDICWNVLHGMPGLDANTWAGTIISRYPTEVADVFGTDDAHRCLLEWWDAEVYEDPATGIRDTYQGWAHRLAHRGEKSP